MGHKNQIAFDDIGNQYPLLSDSIKRQTRLEGNRIKEAYKSNNNELKALIENTFTEFGLTIKLVRNQIIVTKNIHARNDDNRHVFATVINAVTSFEEFNQADTLEINELSKELNEVSRRRKATDTKISLLQKIEDEREAESASTKKYERLKLRRNYKYKAMIRDLGAKILATTKQYALDYKQSLTLGATTLLFLYLSAPSFTYVKDLFISALHITALTATFATAVSAILFAFVVNENDSDEQDDTIVDQPNVNDNNANYTLEEQRTAIDYFTN
jgi:hypothetical protein